ncbi:ATP-dependent DNA helicase RecG [Planctomicrobium piriforme]|uniref:Probable DNA 3'-5' helicase RecG n=1 Tax=Planctomicrobium piriforme TaxID=1576369 RepID=A0A1I3PEP1_9PLAN|nr:ATP-dependent DNA helicase RecG [Planctomicrobium piriforme]SFJ20114.1 ATP-dependent DNA helicase RecG [Planctomicrobium piriforme]
MPFASLDTDVQFLKGVGPDRALLLKKLDIETVGDLLWHLPKDILDFTHICEPHQLQADALQTVRGTVCDLDSRELKNNRILTKVLIDCGTDFVRAAWFNQPWMLRRFNHGQQVLFSGKPKFREGRWEYSHPNVQWLEPDELPESSRLILARYRLTEGIRVGDLRRMIALAIEAAVDTVVDPLPEQLVRQLDFDTLPQAIRGVHLPESPEQFQRSRTRLLFDDFFEFQLGVALRRRAWRARCNAPVLDRSAKIDARIRRLFPFTYTDGQNKAVKEVAADLKSGFAMHRLLQADVGAGKTVVAIDTMLVAVAHGWQAVLMAPTELLATQHWQTVNQALSESRVQRALLTGSLSSAERQKTLAGIADGSIQLIVGTQALIQQGVRFHNLGAVVIDEQHKFGVAQRARFSDNEADVPPHVLVMTATPIPRTLCLTQFGDLDVTVVKDRPEGRQPVITSKITGSQARQKAWQFLVDKLKSGRQLYVVCPLVDSDEETSLGSNAAEQVFRELGMRELAGFKLGLVHGRMKRDEREQTMDAFRDREIDVLIATTVIEVGVDVPNATLMVIIDAERFGLSQLHQLRGRIARGKFRGYCFLFTESTAADSLSRLAVLERSGDGFEVAEQDFEQRGPGDILGTRQHGAMPLRFPGCLQEEKILELARHEAQRVVHSGEFDQEEFAELRRRVLDRFAQVLDLPRSG